MYIYVAFRMGFMKKRLCVMKLCVPAGQFCLPPNFNQFLRRVFAADVT